MWFTTKVRYEKTRENGSLKTITEPYLVDALSFTEAEARITNEMMPYTSGAFSVSAVKRSNISEIFWDENGDHFYKAKISTARFYFKRILPRIAGHKGAIEGGIDSLMELDAEHFAF